MNFRNWFRSCLATNPIIRSRNAASKRTARCRLAVEVLEDRTVPSTLGVSEWVRQFGTIGNDSGQALTADANGNLFVAGKTDGAFPGQTNAGGSNAFVSKYDANGNEVWTR